MQEMIISAIVYCAHLGVDGAVLWQGSGMGTMANGGDSRCARYTPAPLPTVWNRFYGVAFGAQNTCLQSQCVKDPTSASHDLARNQVTASDGNEVLYSGP